MKIRITGHRLIRIFRLIRSKTLPTNDFELTVPDLYCCTNLSLLCVVGPDVRVIERAWAGVVGREGRHPRLHDLLTS